jgi:branched-chain amino acid transport system permease protein
VATVIEFLQAIPYDQILIQTLNGIVTGMILALIASGLTLIFGIMDVVNFAHGELFMLGAYIGVVVLATSGSFWLALIIATLVVALIGAALQVTTLRPLLGRDPLTTILATFGISLVLQNYALWQFGPVARKIQEPFTGHFPLFYLEYPWYRLVIAVLSAAIIGGFWLFLKYGTYGIWIRATTQDRVMAQAMGIPVPWVHTAVFAIGAGMAAASGVLFGPLVGVNHAMGQDWLLKAFIVVVVGGMGEPWGLDCRLHLHQPAGSLRRDLGEPGASGDRLFRRADPRPAVPAHRPLLSDTQMSNATGSSTGPGSAVSSPTS